MSTLLENIKNYFSKKVAGEAAGAAPIGACKICWGHNEWDGKFYDIVKDKHTLPDGDIYDSFISKIADEHVRTTHNLKNKYICTNCDQEI